MNRYTVTLWFGKESWESNVSESNAFDAVAKVIGRFEAKHGHSLNSSELSRISVTKKGERNEQ